MLRSFSPGPKGLTALSRGRERGVLLRGRRKAPTTRTLIVFFEKEIEGMFSHFALNLEYFRIFKIDKIFKYTTLGQIFDFSSIGKSLQYNAFQELGKIQNLERLEYI